jgi:lipopolysaccharide biosynthesis regulator YciM
LEKLLSTLKQLDSQVLDLILDQRDEGLFDRAWCILSELVSESSTTYDAKDILIKLSAVTNSHEVCSYIADDFEFIKKAEVLGIQSEFLDYLKQSYEQGKVPCTWNRKLELPAPPLIGT